MTNTKRSIWKLVLICISLTISSSCLARANLNQHPLEDQLSSNDFDHTDQVQNHILSAAIAQADLNEQQCVQYDDNWSSLCSLTLNERFEQITTENNHHTNIKRNELGSKQLRYWPLYEYATTSAPSDASGFDIYRWWELFAPTTTTTTAAPPTTASGSGGRLSQVFAELGALIGYEAGRSYAIAYERSLSGTANVSAIMWPSSSRSLALKQKQQQQQQQMRGVSSADKESRSKRSNLAPLTMNRYHARLMILLSRSLQSIGGSMGSLLEKTIGLYSTQALEMALSTPIFRARLEQVDRLYSMLSANLNQLDRLIQLAANNNGGQFSTIPIPTSLILVANVDKQDIGSKIDATILMQLGQDLGTIYGSGLGSLVRLLPDALTRQEPASASLANILSLIGCRMGAYVANYLSTPSTGVGATSQVLQNDQFLDMRPDKVQSSGAATTGSTRGVQRNVVGQKALHMANDGFEDGAIGRKPYVEFPELQVMGDDLRQLNVQEIAHSTVNGLIHHTRLVMIDNLRLLVSNVSSYTGCKLGSLIMYAVGIYLEPTGAVPVISSFSELLANSMPSMVSMAPHLPSMPAMSLWPSFQSPFNMPSSFFKGTTSVNTVNGQIENKSNRRSTYSESSIILPRPPSSVIDQVNKNVSHHNRYDEGPTKIVQVQRVPDGQSLTLDPLSKT